MLRQLASSTLFPYTTLFRSVLGNVDLALQNGKLLGTGTILERLKLGLSQLQPSLCLRQLLRASTVLSQLDRKSTRLNSSHMSISYAVFCLKKKKNGLTLKI